MTRSRITLVLVSAAVGVLSLAAVSSQAGPGRGPALIVGYQTEADGRELRLEINTCRGGPAVEAVQENEDSVEISVVADRQDDQGPGCADGTRVRLARPLDGRAVIDTYTGERVPSSSV